MPQSDKTPSRPQCGFVARCPRQSMDSVTNDPICMFEQHEFWMVEKMKTFATLCWEGSESPCFPLSYIISAELRSECISSVRVPKFNCLHSCLLRTERTTAGMLCVLREGCVRTPRLQQHTTQILGNSVMLSQYSYNMIEAQINISFTLLMLTKYL